MDWVLPRDHFTCNYLLQHSCKLGPVIVSPLCRKLAHKEVKNLSRNGIWDSHPSRLASEYGYLTKVYIYLQPTTDKKETWGMWMFEMQVEEERPVGATEEPFPWRA